MRDQLRTAIVAVWLILSLVGLGVIAAPFLLSEEALLGLGQGLQAPHDAERCGLCGMTRAFSAISRGEFERARTLNGRAAALFGALAGNVLAAGAYLITWAVKGRRKKQ